MHIHMLKPLGIRKEKEELTFKSQEAKSRHPGSTNDDVMVSGVIIASPNGDVTKPDLNCEPIARKHYVPKKQSFMPSGGCFKSSLTVCSQTFTCIALLIAIIISVLGGVFNIRLSKRKSTIGTSANLPLCEFFVAISCRDSLFRILREFSTNILSINEGLRLCMMTETNWDNNKRLIRRREVLHNTRIRDEGGYGHSGYSHRYPGCHGYVMPFCKRSPGHFLAGKRLVTYIFLFADFWASSVYYFDIYTVNLELDDKFKVFFDLVCLYIFTFYRSWSFCNSATYPEAIFIEICTLVYFYPKLIVLIIKSHDKYQSMILIGLAPVEKASSENRSIFDHYRSSWREW